MILSKEPPEKHVSLLLRVKREIASLLLSQNETARLSMAEQKGMLAQDSCPESNKDPNKDPNKDSNKVFAKLVASKMVVALSGGPDSVFLLEALVDIFKEEGHSLTGLKACHVNHAVRAESLEDEKFCRELCRHLGVELLVETLPAGPSDEARLRRLRYQSLERACRHFAASYLVAAHHRDDQIETFLFRLFRGTGTDGLAAMPGLSLLSASGSTDAEIKLLRPLLRFNKEEILTWFEGRNQAFVTDISNSQSAYQRNFLRNQVLPMVLGRFPGALDHIEQVRSMMSADRQFFELEVERLLPDLISPSGMLLVAPWLALSPALQNRVLIAYLNRSFPALEVDFKLVGRLHAVLNRQSSLETLKGGLIARLGSDSKSSIKTKVLIIESESENFLDRDCEKRLSSIISALQIFPDHNNASIENASIDKAAVFGGEARAEAIGAGIGVELSGEELSSLAAPGLKLLPWLNAALLVEVASPVASPVASRVEVVKEEQDLAPRDQFTFHLSKEHCQAALRENLPIVLRSRSPGDGFGSGKLKHRLHRLGGRQAEFLTRLADYFPGAAPQTSLQWLRYLPVLALGSRVLWLPGSALNEADFSPKSCADGPFEPIYRLKLVPLGDHLQQTGADGSLTC